jgi:hypothetical protein
MGKVIAVRFPRSRLPRRLLDDGWWLESMPVQPAVIVFPKRRSPDPKTEIRHLTLVKSEK